MIDKRTIEQMKNTLKSGVAVQAVPQLFPTPEKISQKMCSMINLKSTDRILEPQAGDGALVKSLEENGQGLKNIVAIELNHNLCDFLEKTFPDIEVLQGDFLKISSLDLGLFDKVVMNPPFVRLQDIEHIQHAFSFLKAGGELISIVSEGPFFRACKKSVQFRKFLNQQNATIIKLEEESFKESGTLVSSRIIHIKKGVLA